MQVPIHFISMHTGGNTLWKMLSAQVGTLKLVYYEKAKKFCEIFPLLLATAHTDKSKGKILQNFVAFSEYMNFTQKYVHDRSCWIHLFSLDLDGGNQVNSVKLRLLWY